MMAEPVPLSPVKVIASTFGCDVRNSPAEPSPKPCTRLNAPSGTSEAAITSARTVAEDGVSSDGFRIAELPITSAGATFMHAMRSGTFHGQMQAMTPLGRRVAYHMPWKPISPENCMLRFSNVAAVSA